MLSRAAGVAAVTCALGANAILLPPGVNSIDDSLSIASQTAKSQEVRIPCPACAFSTRQQEEEVDDVEGGEGRFTIQGGANDLLLNLTTSEDKRRLELNGASIYPPLPYNEENQAIVYQVPASGDGVKVPLHVTSSGLEMDYQHAVEEESNALVQLQYTIYGVEKQLMELQAVKIDLLKTDGELLIIEVAVDRNQQSPPPLHPPPHHGPPPGFRPHFGGPPPGPPPEMTNEKECNMLPMPVCRFRHMLEAKLAHMRHGRPCPESVGPPHDRLPSHIRPPLPHLPAHGEHPHPHHGRPHHMRPWQGHRHHHHHHWAGAFTRGFIAVLIPVVAGISVGLTVSLLGLVVGRLISLLWIRYARGGQRGTASLERDAVSVEEGKGLMIVEAEEDEEPLPAYEDAPAYEETEKAGAY